MTNEVQKTQDPSPTRYWKLILLSALALIVTGIVVLVIGKIAVGVIITILGAVFGLGAQVSRNNQVK